MEFALIFNDVSLIFIQGRKKVFAIRFGDFRAVEVVGKESYPPKPPSVKVIGVFAVAPAPLVNEVKVATASAKGNTIVRTKRVGNRAG